MDTNEAKELIETTDMDSSEKHQIMRGLQIIAKYKDDVDCYFEHERIYIIVYANGSNFEEIVSKMSKRDVLQMAKLGWVFDEKQDCWAHS